MDLGKVLAEEHSKAMVNRIVRYVGDDKRRFESLVKIYLKGPYRVTQRAAWPLSYCAEAHPEWVKPHLKTLLDFLEKPAVHDAVKRNTIRLLQFISIPKKYEGRVVDICFNFLQSKNEPVAIKAFSITVLAKLIAHEPDLKNELKLILEDQLPYASPAFRVRAHQFLKTV